MPFTFSHPAAVLPLAFIPKRWISVTGLVIGSITPDFEYFLRLQQDSYYSHTLGGIFWFDLPLGLLLVYLFNNIIRRELIENLPPFFNRRFSNYRFFKRDLSRAKELIFVLSSLLIGILSHIIWDKLTHKSVSWIDEEEHYTVFWEANSVAGAILIAAVIFKMRRGIEVKRDGIFSYWLPVLLTTLLFVSWRCLSTSGIRQLGISAIVGFFLGLIITSIIRKWKNSSTAEAAI